MVISNEFSWSATRDSLFRTCKRAYYYQYYESWEGWSQREANFKRIIYIMKNIQTLPLWCGAIVHDVIAEKLRDYASFQNSDVLTKEHLLTCAKDMLVARWRDAVSRRWLREPKTSNIDGLFYGNGHSLPKEVTDSAAERVYGAIAAFADSMVLKKIKDIPYERWKPVDKLDSFYIDNAKVWCAIDFAFTDTNAKLCIVDWKTGAENKEALAIQLACYAYYAGEKWGISPEDIRVFGCFLSDNARVKEYPFSPEHILEARQRMIDSIEEMRSYLRDPMVNEAIEEDFPLCDKDYVCRTCSYRGACAKFVERSQVKLPDFCI